MTNPSVFLQETREFSGEKAGLFFIIKLRSIYGRAAKCTLKNADGNTYVKFRVPDDGRKKNIPNTGKKVEPTQAKMNVAQVNWG